MNDLACQVSAEDIVKALYVGILRRPADESGLETYTAAVRGGVPLSEVINAIMSSNEFKEKNSFKFEITLPDLTQLYPEKYIRKDQNSSILCCLTNEDLRFIESLIVKYRYYDSFGVWSPEVDTDKRVTAAIIKGLGAKSCIELGCFTGPVLSLLLNQGISVCGVEISHLAFVLAYSNIYPYMRYGNLIDLSFNEKFDAFLAMDILEHVNPLDLGRYVERISKLIHDEGFAYINSPMFGVDDIFGTVFDQYLPEWKDAPEDHFWRVMHCDAKGWPMHGHLVWASPRWWEQLFLSHGLVRDREIEIHIHGCLRSFFDNVAPARRSLFVLRHRDFTPSHETIYRQLDCELIPIVAGLGVG
jgi:2-polyprenyl-3-methyl-5-hydroxy-6-metoxy-1,4-benzoquinol methylase